MFCFALAERLGIWNVDQMMADMPGHLLMRWKQFRKLQDPDYLEKLEMDLIDDPDELTRYMMAREGR